MPDQPVLRVAIAVPLRALFDYLPPENTALDALLVGMRLRVPFGKGERIAVLVEIVAESQVEPALLKPVKAILDEQPLLRAEDISFLRWVAAYYQHPSGEVILAALPTRLRKGEHPVCRVESAWQVTENGKKTDLASLQRSPRQRELLGYLQQLVSPARRSEIKQHFSSFTAGLKALIEKGLVDVLELPVEPEIRATEDDAPALNQQQANVVEHVLQQKGFAVSRAPDGSERQVHK